MGEGTRKRPSHNRAVTVRERMSIRIGSRLYCQTNKARSGRSIPATPGWKMSTLLPRLLLLCGGLAVRAGRADWRLLALLVMLLYLGGCRGSRLRRGGLSL